MFSSCPVKYHLTPGAVKSSMIPSRRGYLSIAWRLFPQRISPQPMSTEPRAPLMLATSGQSVCHVWNPVRKTIASGRAFRARR